MQRTRPDRRDTSRAGAAAVPASRAEQITRIYREHADHLRAYVARTAHTDPQTIEDACAHAWTQLLTHPHIDITDPPARTLRWLTTTATREAWRLHIQQPARTPDNDGPTDTPAAAAPTADERAALRARLDLVRELPERPRRFLVRHMLGYTYDEISAVEGVSWRTTERQLAHARALLRQLDTPNN